MRTIIINTLGSELRHEPLFYLPFQESQLLWLDESINGIHTCPEQIAAYQADQLKIQDYHLVVLVSTADYPDAQFDRICSLYKKLLFAHINESILLPLAQTWQIPPAAVSVVYVLKELSDGEGGMAVGKEYDAIFGFDALQAPVQSLRIVPTNGGEPLVMDRMFADAMSDYTNALAFQADAIAQFDPEHALSTLREGITEKVTLLQQCAYTLPGHTEKLQLSVEKLDYFPLTSRWDLLSLDLQINLSEHLAQQCRDTGSLSLRLTPHDERTLRKRVSLARERVQYLREKAPRETFYPLKNQPRVSNIGSLSAQIWADLLAQKGTLPGVTEAHALSENTDEEAVPLLKKPYHAWLLIGAEKKQFEQLCQTLENEYNADAAEAQQATIFDTCAKVFTSWRKKALSMKPALPESDSESEIPMFDATKAKADLAAAQQEFGKICAEQLDDYLDVRKEAEELKARFRKVYRLWPGDGCSATKHFWIYSIILAVAFLLQMMLPYLGLTMGTEGFAVSRYVHFGLSLGLFAGLYLAGLLLWMGALCRQLHALTVQMHELLLRSSQRRRDSIAAVVDAYGRVLPNCTIHYEQLKELEYIHRTNLTRKDRYNTHIDILDKAEAALNKLHTQLRIPEDPVLMDRPAAGAGIDYQKSPSHPDNVSFYVLLSEKWGC